MPGTRRWRLQWWLVGETGNPQAQWYSNDCKLCAAWRARQLAKAYAKVKLAPVSAIRWSVSRMDLHGSEATVVVSSSSVSERLLLNHAHRESGARAIRSDISARRTVGEGSSNAVSGSGGPRSESDVVPTAGRDGKNGVRS